MVDKIQSKKTQHAGVVSFNLCWKKGDAGNPLVPKGRPPLIYLVSLNL